MVSCLRWLPWCLLLGYEAWPTMADRLLDESRR